MEKIQQDVIELFEELLEKQGFSRLDGRILALIYLREVSLTQTQLEKESNFSRSSINKAVNTLLNKGYIRKRQRGEGKELVYYTELRPKEVFLNGIQEYISYFEKIYARFSKLFESSSKIEGLPSKRLKEFIDRLPEINEKLKNTLLEINKLEFIL